MSPASPASSERRNLLLLPLRDLEMWILSQGEPPYRLRQILTWLWRKQNWNIDEWTDLPRSFRQKLQKEFTIRLPEIAETRTASDGTLKMTLQLEDDREVEAVYIPEKDRATVCVSTQVGCALACKFCATGLMGFYRNLTGGEIAVQVLLAQRIGKHPPVRNVVFMGMGEPLMNLPGLLDALTILTGKEGYRLGMRRLTISTVGLPEKIRRLLSATGGKPRLALSLHSAIQEKRERLMPIARLYPLEELVPALREYQEAHRRWLTFEYVLLPGVNDTAEDIDALIDLGILVPAKVNVIPWNPVEGIPEFRPPTLREVYRFAEKLRRRYPYPVTVRKPRGREIQGACGQLIRKVPGIPPGHQMRVPAGS